LYLKGSRGVCVEPNPYLFKKLKQVRERDTCLNVGVAFNEQQVAPFYQFPYEAHGLSTFSQKEAAFWETTGNENVGKFKIEKVIDMPLVSVNTIIKENYDTCPNFISIDVEGVDLQILHTLEFDKYKPEVFCIECIRYSKDNKESIDNGIVHFMQENGYFIYASTHINTIFCRRDVYKPMA
jgi:FkbM family methyltransferase